MFVWFFKRNVVGEKWKGILILSGTWVQKEASREWEQTYEMMEKTFIMQIKPKIVLNL